MAGKARVVYWDTNVFISLFNGFRDQPDRGPGITYWHQQADLGVAVVVTSTLTYAELLEHDLTPAEYARFLAFMARIEVKAADIGVMRQVKLLREHFGRQPKPKEQKHKLCTPDAIHLATAIIFECQEFHTFDEQHNNRCTGLLKLGALPEGVRVKICKPEAPQPPPEAPQRDLIAELERLETERAKDGELEPKIAGAIDGATDRPAEDLDRPGGSNADDTGRAEAGGGMVEADGAGEEPQSVSHPES